ncbi:MAG: hypothetical protein FVQ82_11450 [Planctomycetes bacterium]|nr:hypothetical protein [Planctomycetota bacterium]
MSVEFILGRSGSGKTTRCISSIIEELGDDTSDAPLVLLVPEQATYQAERTILTSSGVCGFSRLKVLSFNRLEFLLSGQAGGKDISRLGKEMVVQKILRENRENLQVFKESAARAGLATELTSTIIELHECDKSCKDIEALIAELNKNDSSRLAAMKFSDISLVLEQYLDFLDGNFLNPDIQLTYARQKVAAADFLKGGKLWVDGFASFTIQQRALLAEMAMTAGQTHIALCMDPERIDAQNPKSENLDPAGIFNLTEKTFTELFEIIKECKLTISPPVILDKIYRFANAPALKHLERNIFTESPQPPISIGDNITLSYASGRRAEVKHLASEINSLVRDKGLRFRDIAVIASDISSYQHYIDATFTDCGIEYFIDTPKPMQQHPVVELITSALSAATGGFSSSDIFAYLKTQLADITAAERDQLENYCLAFGVEGQVWLSGRDWSFAAGDDNRYDQALINIIRRRVTAPLIKLKDTLPADGIITANEFTSCIFELLKELNVQAKIEGWVESGQNDPAAHQQLFHKLVEIFDELTDVFADDKLDVEELISILQNAFSSLTLKLIPQKLDQVLVGSIDRSRHPELKAVFLIGTTQRQFPAAVSMDAILTDEDRAFAGENDFMLAERIAEQLAARQYLAYIAFTRPSEYLFISSPLTDDDGKQILPSPFLNNLRNLFTDLKPIYVSNENASIENVRSVNELTDLLCEKLAADKLDKEPELQGLVDSLCADLELAGAGGLIKRSLNYRNCASLDGDRWPGLGDTLRCSTSRLKSFATCPYQHFAKYILKLKDRDVLGFEPMDIGNFYHKVLEGVAKDLKTQGKDFGTAEDDELKQTCIRQTQKVIEKDVSINIFLKRGHHNKFIIEAASEVLLDCVVDLGKLSRAGCFRQKCAEAKFGMDDSDPTQLVMPLSGGGSVILRGIIDRIDIADIDGQKAAVVYDYKRRETSVAWDKLYNGLDMQLGVYMIAAKNIVIDGKKPDISVGAFYLPVESPGPRKENKYARKAKGIFNGELYEHLSTNAAAGWNEFYNFFIGKDAEPYGNYGNSGALRPEEFDNLLKFVEDKITALAEEILSGKIDISPFRLSGQVPCDYCDFKKLCRFDIHFNEYNELQPMKKDGLINSLGGVDA